RQDRRRPEIRQRRAEGGLDADLFPQWREDQGRDLVRRVFQEDQRAPQGQLIGTTPRSISTGRSSRCSGADSRLGLGQDSFSRITPAKGLGKETPPGCRGATAKPLSGAIRAPKATQPPHRHCLLWYCPGREIRALPRKIPVDEADASSPPRFQVVR